ncbi:7042_t:CDS:2, partial [Dentiscutata heterogama]
LTSNKAPESTDRKKGCSNKLTEPYEFPCKSIHPTTLQFPDPASSRQKTR